MHLAGLGRPFSVSEAYDALDEFGRRSGRVRLLLLLHASVPQSFRADLLNLLKMNFLASEAGTDLTVDADVLLSPLVRPAAAGYYCLDPEVRRHGLALLDAVYRDQRERRSVEVSRFLLVYADALERQAALALDAMLAEYLAIQRWVALAFMDPNSAAEAFARAIESGLDQPETVATLRLGSVTAAMSVPLTGHQELLAYARGIDAIAVGDTTTGDRLLEWIGDDELRVGGVTLRPGTRARQLFTRSARESDESGPSDVLPGGPGTSKESFESATRPEPAAAPSTGSAQVYFIYDKRDAEAIQPWATFLFNEFEILHPVFDGDEAEIREYNEECLRSCDGVVIFYGAGNETWLRRKLREVQKSAGYGRTKPASDVAICCIAPKTPAKEQFRSHDATVIQQWDGLSPEAWQPFVSRVREHVAAQPENTAGPADGATAPPAPRASVFQSDVYISYAKIDDSTLVEGRMGWVTNFQRALKIRVSQLLGRDLRTWFDPKLEGNDAFTSDLLERLRSTAMFVAIVSPRYVRSEWTVNELREFSKAAEAISVYRPKDKSRVFKVVKAPVPLESQPPPLQSLLGYEFFRIDPESGKVREFDEIFGADSARDFWIKLDDLAQDIVQLINQLEANSGSTPDGPAA